MKAIKLLFGMAAVAGALTVTSCGDDDNGGGTEKPTTENLSGAIGTKTLTNDKVWVVDGMSYVEAGNTLTIEPGTIIKFEDSPGADASALVIAKGAKIDAEGTASQPIIFTSVNDDIKIGETKSSGLDNNLNGAGQWGGLIILGDAPISAGSKSQVSEVSPIGSQARIEGVPAASYSIYGGDNANDNSGTLKYVSIRYTGTTLSSDSEIQGLTLGGVGSGTDIENIEIFVSDDDGIEFFGGTVDVNNVVIAYQKDDGLDIDQNYAGTIDNAVVLNYTEDLDASNTPTDQGALEIDGPESKGVNDEGRFTIKNSTIINKAGDKGFPGQFKSKAQGTLDNVSFEGFSDNARKLEIESMGAGGISIINSNFSQSEIDLNGNVITAGNNNYNVDNSGKGATANFDWTYSKELGLF